MWTRPCLCLLCEFPASDGGVRVDQLDAAKLSKWWRRTIGAEFDAEESDGEIICQFCLWDARLEHEHSLDECTSGPAEECDWWSGHDNDKFFRKFYHQDEVIQCCRVELGPDVDKIKDEQFCSESLLKNTDEKLLCDSADKIELKKLKRPNKSFKCFVCGSALSSQHTLVRHMHRHHPGQFLECKFNGWCIQVFRTEEEKKEHKLKAHKAARKCQFCNKMYRYSSNIVWHMQTHHKNLVRCNYQYCATYFSTEDEMQKHITQFHPVQNKQKCIFCRLFFSDLLLHLRKKHKAQLPSVFKCTFEKSICNRYFLTEEERENHFNIVHKQHSAKCIYCERIYIDKRGLRNHVYQKHLKIKIMCPIHGCSQYFLTQIESESHVDQMHRDKEEKKKFKCPKCNYRATFKCILKKHEAQSHGARDKVWKMLQSF